MKIAEHYKDLKKELGGASDTVVALVMIAEQLQIMNGRAVAVCLDGEQMGYVRKGLEGIAGAVFGVGQMVEKIGRDECAEIVTNEQVEQ